ncbi:MAG: DUF2341 domain-containing protein, partial [Gammaproteobacteria bacterium]|nr:DUF2341 domain-containing protein [Gammaproteobacteria bacterium]
MLFSADLFGAAVDGAGADDPVQALLDGSSALQPQSDTEADDPAEQSAAITPYLLDESEYHSLIGADDTNQLRSELVFVDPATPNYQQLLDDLLSREDENRQIEVVMLEADTDGVAQIGDILAGFRDLDAVHIISHSSDGAIRIGSSTLDQSRLDTESVEIGSWSQAFNADGDLLIYGCDPAASGDGELFVDTLAQLTGADVIASKDLTCHASSSDGYDIVLIDSRLQDSGDLLNSVADDTLTFVYDSAKDSAADVFRNVFNWAGANNAKIDSLSILSHGTEGAFQLGTDWITKSTLDADTELWQQLGSYMTTDANIYILGCDVAGDEGEGQPLLDELANLTGADLFASDDVTGVGGDWVLETASAGSDDELSSGIVLPFDMQSLKATDVSLAWFDVNWGYRQQVTIDQSMVSGSNDLSNFAVLVTLTDASLKSTSNGGNVGQTDGGDIVFTSADGTTQLDHQIESYNAATGELVVWVEIPTLSATADTELFLYYGNAGAVNQWNDAGTWDASYAGVWHLGADYQDSTSNNNDGTNSGTTNDPTGQIGAGDDFNGTSNYISTTSNEAKTANSFTISTWFNADATDYAHHLLWEGTATGNGWGSPEAEMHISLGTNNDGSPLSDYVSFFLGDDSVFGQDPLEIFTAFTDTTGWHQVTVVVSNMSTTPTAAMYLDGVLVGTDTGSLADTSRSNWNTDLQFGKPGAASRYFDGQLDEVRLATTTRSADWIATEYNNQNAPATYITFGSESTPNDIINTVPGSQTTNEDTALVFSSGNGNAISVTGDAGQTYYMVLSVTNGSLSLSGVSGLTFTDGDGTSDASMSFSGTLEDVNAALAGLGFSPTADYNGGSTLTITSNDATLYQLNIDANLKGYYSFDNTGDLGNDDSPGGTNDGTVNGATATVNGTRGDVLSFDGNDYAQINGHFGNPANVTLAAWVNLTAADTSGSEVISLGDSVALRLDAPTHGVQAFMYNGSTWTNINSGQFLAGSGWHHVAYTYDNATHVQTLYIDGVAAGSNTVSGSISYTLGANSFIGKHGDGQTTFDFNGLIDDVRVYDRTLDASEVGALADDLNLQDTDTVAITVTPVNDAPTGTNGTITAIEDTDYVFSTSDFGFSDADGDAFDRVWIATLPSQGTLKWNGSGFSAGNYIMAEDIDLGLLTWTPPANVSGAALTSFTFQVQDDSASSNLDLTPNTMTVDVTAQND